ncbi:MAG: ATP-binding protein, partial [Bacteroidales bacterium]|nr:ATP-binding protein [Bacteroidales bacterium]
MSWKNPIKFLDSYSREDKDIFFGRDKETSILYEKVGQSKIVLLYGLSGTGKTSLINCGLENRFEAGQRIFIYVRRGSHILKSLRQSIANEASSLIHPNAGAAEALEILYYDFLKPVTIIFDQFEELFISGEYDERQLFIKTIAEILDTDLNVKFIFSLREEYLAHMDEFEEKIPIIFDHRHRLEKMRHATLEEVITRIAEKGETALESEKIPDMIIKNISDRKGNVELPYLQVYLDKLTRLMAAAGNGKVFTTKLVDQAGKLEDVLGDFLEEQISRIASEMGSKEAVNHILKQMITPDGTK